MSDIDRVVRFLVITARCGECGGKYNADDVHVLDQTGRTTWELAAVCPGCLSVWLVKAVLRGRGVPASISSAGTARPAAVTGRADELTLAERRRFQALAPICVDDVLDASSFLSTFDGDFHAFFGVDPGAD